jgi:hypothetical protein
MALRAMDRDDWCEFEIASIADHDVLVIERA